MASMEALIDHLSRSQIRDFFRNNTAHAQEECDQLAAQILDGPIRPSTVQGVSSYTVLPVDENNMFVVQFRATDDAFDLDLLRYVEQAYRERFMPRHQLAYNLGGLLVYTMDKVRGVSVYLARDQLRANGGRLLSTTLEDFAE